MDIEQLYYLIRQPEGLKLDFKSNFYEINAADPQARERQWGELIKDIIALANGNVNIAGERGYIIFGVGDKVNPDGSRQLHDVGNIQITRQQILAKVNSICNPPLADLYCDLLLVQGQRIFIITIPPSPHLHETTKRLQTSRGQSFPEHTVFIRRGEGTHTASMPEIQAIVNEKQKLPGMNIQNIVVKDILETQKSGRNFFDRKTIIIIVTFGVILPILGYLDGENTSDRAISALVAFVLSLIVGFLFSMLVKLIHWIIQKQQKVKAFAYFMFWGPVIFTTVLSMFMAKNNEEILQYILTGITVGTGLGILLSVVVCGIDWFIGKLKSYKLIKR